ncbi:hypothetical protein SAMN05444166_6667 [Singulisphaera sp. GP187]|uniref:hypothetical protein n=1 Tax=Singulisphaera sp. GP187 TaxID=1882752 RepID=UPI00092C63E2|nr:hypothetical protein [Singulisphaera sp. GP187]SIO61174.1 hypothetical protein SAMN05444166_6667 [Singulisphaera sp. GP187]
MGLAWIAITVVLTAPGCARIPVPRANSNQVHLPNPRPDSLPAPVPLVATKSTAAAPERTEGGERLPPLPLSPQLVSLGVLSAADAPTPWLDEALAKVDAEAEHVGVTDASLNREAESTESARDEPAVAPRLTQESAPPLAPEPPAGPAPDPKLMALRALTGSQSAPGTINPEKSVKPIDPRELWSEGLARLRTIASEQAKAAGPGTWSQRAHLLEAIAEEDLKGIGKSEPARPWRMALAALGIPHSSATTATDEDEPPRGAEIRAAVVALEGEAPLEISDLRLCRKVNGFGNFDPLDTAACKAGQPLIVYCEMSGLQYSAAGEQFHSRLSSRVELVPSSGGDPVWAQSLGSAEDVCRRRRRDYYVNYRIILADTIPPGVYELRVVQKDEIAGHSTSASIPLTIQR